MNIIRNFYKATYPMKQKKLSPPHYSIMFTFLMYTAVHSHYTQDIIVLLSLFQAPAEVFLHDGIVPIPLGHASLCYADIIL